MGIVTGPAGSGKSTVVRRVVGGREYVAVLSVGLVCGVKSLVDGLAEEVRFFGFLATWSLGLADH